MKKILLVSLLMFASASIHSLAATRSPNIIIFLMDDMGYGDVRVLNPKGSGFATPNLDALVQSGISFDNAHSSASVCAPTRYALLTGNHVYRGRNPGGTRGHFEGNQIVAGQRTIADTLRAVGYRTAFFGKSHLGSAFHKKGGSRAKNFAEADLSQPFKDGPRDHGFDYSLTLPSGIQSEPYAFFQNDRLTRWNNDVKAWEGFKTDAAARKHFRKDKKGAKGTSFQMDNWSTETVGPLLMHDALGFIDRHVDEQG